MVFSWAIIRVFYSIFIKSISDYGRIFLVKCGQFTYYELIGIYVTESFIVGLYKNLLTDSLVEEDLPILNDEKDRKNINLDETPLYNLFSTAAARSAWKDYLVDTKYSNAFFAEQKKRMKEYVTNISKRTEIFMSKVNYLETKNQDSGPDEKLNSNKEKFKKLQLLDKKSIEEIIINDEPYIDNLKMSHVSLAMKKFHDIDRNDKSSSILYKFPLKTEKKISQLNRNFNNNQRKITKTIEFPKVEKSPFVNWIKKGIKNELSHKLID